MRHLLKLPMPLVLLRHCCPVLWSSCLVLLSLPLLSRADDKTVSLEDNPLENVRFVIGTLPAGSARRANSSFNNILRKADQAPSLINGYTLALKLLQQAGYTEMGWYPLVSGVNGVGLLPVGNFKVNSIIGVGGYTKVEQYDDTGKSLQGTARWSQQLPASGVSSLAEFLQVVLHGAKPGKYRSFFVAITEGITQQQSVAPPDLRSIRDLRISGSRVVMPGWMDQRPYRELILTIVVYEFNKSSADGEVTFHQDSDHGIDFHLAGAGLMGLFN